MIEVRFRPFPLLVDIDGKDSYRRCGEERHNVQRALRSDPSQFQRFHGERKEEVTVFIMIDLKTVQ